MSRLGKGRAGGGRQGGHDGRDGQGQGQQLVTVAGHWHLPHTRGRAHRDGTKVSAGGRGGNETAERLTHATVAAGTASVRRTPDKTGPAGCTAVTSGNNRQSRSNR